MVGTTAMLIGAAISAGSKVASSAIASHGAKEAAKTQVAAGDRAAAAQQAATADTLAFQRSQLERQQRIMQPYLDNGQQAYTTLGAALGMGGPKPTAGAPPPEQQTAPWNGPGWSTPVTQPGGGIERRWQGPGPNPMFQPGTPGYAADHPDMPPQAGMPGGPGMPPLDQQQPDVMPPPEQQTASGYATPKQPEHARIAWPDGSFDTVPTEHMDQYELLGARRA